MHAINPSTKQVIRKIEHATLISKMYPPAESRLSLDDSKSAI